MKAEEVKLEKEPNVGFFRNPSSSAMANTWSVSQVRHIDFSKKLCSRQIMLRLLKFIVVTCTKKIFTISRLLQQKANNFGKLFAEVFVASFRMWASNQYH